MDNKTAEELTTQQVLKALGFKLMTGCLWKHNKTFSIIYIQDDTKPSDLAELLLNRGADEQNAIIRATLGIK